MKLSVITCLIALAGATLSGCGLFSPETGGPPIDVPPEYPILSHPENVLRALSLAYENEDSIRTKTLYDSSYVGTSEDLANPNDKFTFSYYDEIDHVAALGRNLDVNVQSFTLGTSLVRQPSDDLSHPDWSVIQIVGSNFSIDVVIQSAGDILRVAGSNEIFEFKFQPTVDLSSPSDTLWKIIRWEETKL